MVASVTDSPSVGTRISVIVFFPQYPVRSSSAKADDPVIRDDLEKGDAEYRMPRSRGA
jgi:hypothetical protein